jgi:peptidoglycan/LPS O-acetylase OafA/YrhL
MTAVTHNGVMPVPVSVTYLRARSILPRIVSGLRGTPERLRRRTSGTYKPEIDGLRFFAITMVVLGHSAERLNRMYTGPRSALDRLVITFFSAPGSGVMLFFAISGFIIAAQFIKQPLPPLSGQYLKRYLRRRVLRIEPPYVILLLLTYIGLRITGFVPAHARGFWMAPKSLATSLWCSLLYSHGWLFGTRPRLFGPGWSLEIEVQFYLLGPLLFWLYFRASRVRVRAIIAAGIILMSSFLAQGVPDENMAPFGTAPHLYFTILRFFPYFALGIVLADLAPQIRSLQLSDRHATLAGVLGLAFLWLTPFTQGHWAPAALVMIVELMCIAAMFVAALTERSRFRAFSAATWISFIGGACYSIYLTHLAPIQFVTAAAVKAVHLHSFVLELLVALAAELPVVLAVAVLFYAVVERTFMISNWPQLAWEKTTRLRVYRGSVPVAYTLMANSE